MSTDGVNRSDWVQRPDLDLFSEANRAAVETALSNRSAVVFGWRYHYYGGSSRSIVAFTNWEDYRVYVERARPGDHFTLFDLNALLDLAAVHVGDIHSTDSVFFDESTQILVGQRLRSLENVLADEDTEVLVIRRFADPLTGATDVALTELPGTGDERKLDFDQLLRGRGELVIFDQQTLDVDEHGNVVETVSGHRRVHALVDAKKPSPDGTVPLSGAY